MPPSKYRVYIFDEAQNLSNASQTALLKFFEDAPKSAIWMICTAEPKKILSTLRSRCAHYPIRELSDDRIEKLVRRAFKNAGSKKRATPLIKALKKADVGRPRLILQTVEKYLAGEDPERAAQQAREDMANDDERAPSSKPRRTALPDGFKHTKDGVRISGDKYYFNVMAWKSKKPGRTTVRFAMAGQTYEYSLNAANMNALRRVLDRGGN
jgi:hypothetical protein